eukprot:CAMPEP_0202899144 /NCGR_PEP_ID=MMETSP1392-20130828/7463_1 /ASSEMBLY_ACC=CAM_ASM_000868 /TAXON_ID=225041 /ORGANISM="Chlamydomonas chlamydogama, Strain SAG 11-48b" /LENGTH=154 /DNA_ID=CAMNT_0049585255 /DNA_START=756 /DNA_END=1218 /DNA_ORIENTATION=+
MNPALTLTVCLHLALLPQPACASNLMGSHTLPPQRSAQKHAILYLLQCSMSPGCSFVNLITPLMSLHCTARGIRRTGPRVQAGGALSHGQSVERACAHQPQALEACRLALCVGIGCVVTLVPPGPLALPRPALLIPHARKREVEARQSPAAGVE